MKTCFKNEIKKTADSIKECRSDNDLCFALLTDSCMSEEVSDTIENIKAVDSEIGFDFIVHLGNIINGDNPELISRRIYESEIERFKNSIAAKKLFVTQGYTDGWRNETYIGQLAKNIMTDEVWYYETSFINSYENVSRPANKPYYFADIPDKNVRLIFLCSYNYQINTALGLFDKYTGISVEQASWLMTDALVGCEGKEVIIFSHRIPKSRFELGTDPFIYAGFSTEQILAIIQQAQKRGVRLVCHFGGGYGCDCEAKIAGINHAIINSQLASNTFNAKCDGVRTGSDRTLNTVNQDCWDAAVLKPKERELRLFRFGCGTDRIIKY